MRQRNYLKDLLLLYCITTLQVCSRKWRGLQQCTVRKWMNTPETIYGLNKWKVLTRKHYPELTSTLWILGHNSLLSWNVDCSIHEPAVWLRSQVKTEKLSHVSDLLFSFNIESS